MVNAIPLLWLKGWHAPAGRRTCEPRPLARPGRSHRQRRWVPQKPGPGRQIVSKDNPSGVSRIGGQAGTQAPTLRPHHHKTGEAGPEALPTSSLPIIRYRSMTRSPGPGGTERPVLALSVLRSCSVSASHVSRRRPGRGFVSPGPGPGRWKPARPAVTRLTVTVEMASANLGSWSSS